MSLLVELHQKSEFVAEASWDACGGASEAFSPSPEDSSESEDSGLGAQADGDIHFQV